MRIVIKEGKEFFFDEEKERQRLLDCFKGKTLKRQLELFEEFLKLSSPEGDIEKVKDLYHNLPYCKKEECAEQEFVGLWMNMLSGERNIIYKFLKKEKTTIEVKK